MEGTLNDIDKIFTEITVESKDELISLILNVEELNKLNSAQLSALRNNLGNLGFLPEEIQLCARILNNCIDQKTNKKYSTKAPSGRKRRGLMMNSKLGKVKTPSERRAAKGEYKDPSAWIIYNRNGGK